VNSCAPVPGNAPINQRSKKTFEKKSESRQEYMKSDQRISDAISKLLTKLKMQAKKAGFNVA
jgi:hypothetical protein